MNAQEWKPIEIEWFETNALAAIKETSDNLVVTAGPGSGKTEMLAQKADFLLKTGICKFPKRILALSFKVDAKNNIKDRVYKRSGRDFAARFDSYTFHSLAKSIVDQFREFLTGSDTLSVDYTITTQKSQKTSKSISYNELIPLATKIINNCHTARNLFRITYSHIFLDEFQDCTSVQYDLIKAISKGSNIRITAVGDTKQSIMLWAGAMEGIFSQFKSDFSAKSLSLYINFRSKPNLLKIQNEFIKELDPQATISSSRLSTNSGKVCIEHFRNETEEAEYITRTISDEIKNRISPSEISILIRNKPDRYSRELTSRLKDLNIPVEVESNSYDFKKEPIVKFLTYFLICLYGESEPFAWSKLSSFFEDFKINSSFSNKKEDYITFFHNQRKKRNSPLREIINNILEYIGQENILSLSSDYQDDKKLNISIDKLEEEINTHQSSGTDMLDSIKNAIEDNKVRIMTIHKSKGLEFDTVFLIGIEEAFFPPNNREELSTFFVGLSRAKNNLVFTHCDIRNGINRTPQKHYLELIEKGLVQKIN